MFSSHGKRDPRFFGDGEEYLVIEYLALNEISVENQ